MYARSQDEALSQSGSAPLPLPIQLYPYHQQAFHQQRFVAPQPGYNVDPSWVNGPEPRPHRNTYAPPQSVYQVQNPAMYAATGTCANDPRLIPYQPPLSLQFPQPSSIPPQNFSPTHDPYANDPVSMPTHAPPVAPPSTTPSPPPPFSQGTNFVPISQKEPIHDDEDELARVLEMSKTEMVRRQKEEEKLSSQEEEELARALAESLRMAERGVHIFGGESSSMPASSSKSVATVSEKSPGDLSPLSISLSLPLPDYASASVAPQRVTPGDEVEAIKWRTLDGSDAINKLSSSPASFTSSLPVAGPSSETSVPPRHERSETPPLYDRLYKSQTETLSSSLAAMESLQETDTAESRLVFDDEAYARQLLAEEEEEFSRRFEEKGRMEMERLRQPEPEAEEGLPQYTREGVLSADIPPGDSQSNRPPSNANEVPLPAPSSSHPSSSNEVAQPQYPPQPHNPRLSMQTVGSSSSASSSVQASQSGRATPHGNHLRPHSYSASATLAGSPNAHRLSRHTSAGVVNPNHFIDRELLTGVSIGFKPPVLSATLMQMQEPMPNIISLPSTRCPPLHLQTTNWRHMLRLLARLSNTRIEPTVEALAISKEIKLRTVVQFVRPHHQVVNAWRTILWFTIDHPVPPNAPGAARYQSWSPNMLPWSYTLQPVPVLLRDSADTIMSKTYTIPATDAVRLPTLPITFPELAVYLHAVLEDSRKHMRSDGSSGLGKLGKMVQVCYPNVEDDYDDDVELGRSGVADLFKRVIGRGNKDRKKKGKINNDTYQMVIPFVSEEWG